MPRKHNRAAILLEIILEFSSGSHVARISDLSLGGCFVDSIASVKKGEVLDFRLGGTNEQSEKMSGEVAYVLPGFGFGLKFTAVSENQKLALANMIIADGGTL